jgi:DNA-binding SARP family transcriptional activator/tetratricopeptide (TPR) repeat protein
MFYLRTLGRPEIRVGSLSVALRPKEAALLAFLCDHAPRSFTRQFIASAMWPTRECDSALHSLSQLIYQLRRKAPGLPLAADIRSLSLIDVSSDIRDLRRLVNCRSYKDALELLNGLFLNDDPSATESFRAWYDAQHEEVLELAELGLQGLIIECQNESDWTCVSKVCHILLQAACPPKIAFEGLIVSHLRTGRYQKALQLHTRLVEAYDSVPSMTHYEGIVSSTATGQRDGELTKEVRFSGRTEELERLRRMWLSAEEGNGQLALITGEAGIGKTRLAHQLLRRVALSGGRVWTSRCHSAKRRIPFSGVADLLLENVGEEYILSPDVRAIVEMFTTAGPAATGKTMVGDHATYQMLDALLDVIGQITEGRPLAVLVDDVQWADEFTARLLTLWGLRLPRWRALLVMTVRTHEAEQTPDWVTQDLACDAIHLGQLTVESADDIVRSFEQKNSVTLPAALRTKITWESAGRPLLLLEALSSAVITGLSEQREADAVFLPKTTEALLRKRFHHLSHDAAWLSGLLAVRGQPQDPGVLAGMSGQPDFVVAAVLEELSSRGIVELARRKIGFVHDLMRETAYRQLSPITRAILHLRVAEQLAGEGANEGVLALHYAEGGDQERAGHFGLSAARAAKAMCLYSDAEFYYRLVLKAGSDDARKAAAREFAKHLALVGRALEIGTLLDVLSDSPDNADVWLLSRLFRLEQERASGQSQVSQLLATAREIICMGEAIESSDLALSLGLILDVGYESGIPEFGEEITRALASAANASTNPIFRTEAEAFLALWDGVATGYEKYLSAMNSFEGSVYEDASVLTAALEYYVHGTLTLLSGGLRRAESLLEGSLALAKAAGDLGRAWAVHANLGLVLLELAEFDTARQHMEAMLGAPALSYKLRAHANLAVLYYESGEDELALNTVRLLARMEASFTSVRSSSTAAAVAGLVHLRAERWEAANDMLVELHYDDGKNDYLFGDVGYTVQFIALMLARTDRYDAALALLDSSINHVQGRDRLRVLRLTCTKAQIIAAMDQDRAYPLAKFVEREAQLLGAKNISRAATRVVSATRIQL